MLKLKEILKEKKNLSENRIPIGLVLKLNKPKVQNCGSCSSN